MSKALRSMSTESSGGVALPRGMSSTRPSAATEPPTSRRRRPRKLNREAANPSSSEPKPPTEARPQKTPDIKIEISALKTRVNDIEAAVQSLLEQRRLAAEGATTSDPAAGQRKVPRRRQRRRKKEGEKESEIEELERLRAELTMAGEELAALRDDRPLLPEPSRERSKNRDEEESDVEEIHRSDVAERPSASRAVTFSGSYRIPLPATVSERDLRAVKDGLSSVQNIARSFIEQSRSQEDDMRSREVELHRTRSGSGWSSWFGGYTTSVARFVNNIEINSTPDSPGSGTNTPRPALQTAKSAPAQRRKPPKLRVGGRSVPRQVEGGPERLDEKQIKGLLA